MAESLDFGMAIPTGIDRAPDEIGWRLMDRRQSDPIPALQQCRQHGKLAQQPLQKSTIRPGHMDILLRVAGRACRRQTSCAISAPASLDGIESLMRNSAI